LLDRATLLATLASESFQPDAVVDWGIGLVDTAAADHDTEAVTALLAKGAPLFIDGALVTCLRRAGFMNYPPSTLHALLLHIPDDQKGNAALFDGASIATNQGHAGRLAQFLTCLRRRCGGDVAAPRFQAVLKECIATLVTSTVFPCVAAGGGKCERCKDPTAPPHSPTLSYSECVHVLGHFGVTPGGRLLAAFRLSVAERREFVKAAATGPQPLHLCLNCGNYDALVAPKRCSRCKEARYCDAACAKQHWRAHKPGCVKVAVADGL